MSTYHDEIEIEDMEYDEETETYFYPCTCGDKFQISKVKMFFSKGLGFKHLDYIAMSYFHKKLISVFTQNSTLIIYLKLITLSCEIKLSYRRCYSFNILIYLIKIPFET